MRCLKQASGYGSGREPGAARGAASVYVMLHLNGVLAAGPITPLGLLREAMLHFSAAPLWGYLFWRYGFATALAAHLSAHVSLQLALTLLLR